MNSGSKIPVSVGILTLNAEHFLPTSLQSVANFDDVYVCDGNSTDRTVDIAREHAVRVEKQFDSNEVNQRVTDFGVIFNRTMSFAKYDWYLRIDVDEVITPALAQELHTIAIDPNPVAHVYKIPRHYVYKGEEIKDSITYPNNQVRFFKRSAVKGFEKIAHERLVPNEGEIVAVTTHPMLVHVLDEYFSEKRIDRALEWDRLEYTKNMDVRDYFYSFAHTTYIMLLFGLRAIRVYFFYRGPRLPFAFDWWRYRYMARSHWLATKIVVMKVWDGLFRHEHQIS